MRALAAGLRSDAQALGDVGSKLRTRFESIDFYGPAADRIESRTGAVGRACTEVTRDAHRGRSERGRVASRRLPPR
jgi:hypothetical protein